MESVITGLVSRFGYWGVLLLIAVENIFPPIPSEVILTFGGFLTTCTEMTPPGVILFSGRVGRVLKMESADVHKASDWFAAHGWPSVFYCRCIPILRSLISIPAGMAGMHPAPFLLLTTVGSLLWNILLVYLGALAGQSWPAVTAALEQASGWVKAVLVVACAAGVSALFYGRRKKREAARQCAVPEREETQKEK